MKNPSSFLCYFQSKKVFDLSEIKHFKCVFYVYLELFNENLWSSDAYDVVYVDVYKEDVTNLLCFLVQCVFVLASLKAKLVKMAIYLDVPSSRSLFEAIKGLF